MDVPRTDMVFACDEVAIFWRYLHSSLDRLIAVNAGRTLSERNWRPLAPATNSVHVLAVHTIANARENILGTLCGQPIARDHEAEFASVAEENDRLISSWPERRRELEHALSTLSSSNLDVTYAHPRRGPVTGREVLIVVIRHAAEHLCQADLTRDLVAAAHGRDSP